MAGKVKLENFGSWVFKLYDKDGDVVDVWEVENGKFAISPEAKKEMDLVPVVRGEDWR